MAAQQDGEIDFDLGKAATRILAIDELAKLTNAIIRGGAPNFGFAYVSIHASTGVKIYIIGGDEKTKQLAALRVGAGIEYDELGARIIQDSERGASETRQ